MLRVVKNIDRFASAPIRSADLSRPQVELLAAVVVEGLSQQACADRLLVTKGNIAQHLERFEMHGLIARRREGRTHYLSLTEAGRELLDRILPEHNARIEKRFGILTRGDFEQLHTIIRKLDRSIR